MITEAKLTANRINGRKSRGPKTAQGKAQARRNALRHGLAAIALPNPVVSAQVERMARMICRNGVTAASYEHALRIAEAELLLQRVLAARVAAIERGRASVLGSLPASKDAADLHAGGDLAGARERIAIDRSRPASDGLPAQVARNEVEALRAALPELVKLERYEQRAWSRRQRSIRQFLASTLLRADALSAPECNQRGQ